MKIVSGLLAALILSLTFSCAKDAVKPSVAAPAQSNVPTPVTTASIPKDGNYDGRGVVTKINLKLASIEINHEDIPDVMPAMQMEFYVNDKAILNGLKVGDKVNFVLQYKHPMETIASIRKVE